jgi:hypothetical protein
LLVKLDVEVGLDQLPRRATLNPDDFVDKLLLKVGSARNPYFPVGHQSKMFPEDSFHRLSA